MNTINSVENKTTVTMSDSYSGLGSSSSDRGVIGLMDNLILELQNMHGEHRDMQRDFYVKGVDIKYSKLETAMKTKQEAIQKNYDAALKNANGAMISGFIGAGGSALGLSSSKFRNNGLSSSISDVGSGVGKGIESIYNKESEKISREAKNLELLGDFQTTLSEDFNKNLANAADSAKEASRKMLDLTRELISLQDRILSQVKF